ncbi:MAG: SDR family oxidoreductase [Parvibaculales bacterium]
MTDRHLFCFGYGFSAKALVSLLRETGEIWRVTATVRNADKRSQLEADGVEPVEVPTDTTLDGEELKGVTHVLLSAPPEADGSDPALRLAGDALLRCETLQWVGYLSTTGVYGDHDGAWIDEDTPPGPLSERGRRRHQAEAAWAATGLPMHYFRLAGIYGPGRNSLQSLRNGTARRINKPGQVFSRIHVEDIALILQASMSNPNPGRAYSVCDDLPAPPQDVVQHAAALLDMDPPPETPFAEADLSPMAKSFYGENKRIRNDRIKRELGVELKYPTYREGLAALLVQE